MRMGPPGSIEPQSYGGSRARRTERESSARRFSRAGAHQSLRSCPMYDELLGEEAERRAVWAALTGAWRAVGVLLLCAGIAVGVVAAALGGTAGLVALGRLPGDGSATAAVAVVLGLAGGAAAGPLAWAAVRLLAAHRSPNGVLILATPTTSAQPSHVRVVSRTAADAQ